MHIARIRQVRWRCCATLFGNRARLPSSLLLERELVHESSESELATRLYYDPGTGSFRRGAGSDTKGGARRLAALLNQLDLTFYLYGMTCEEILPLLPKEFDRFRKFAVS